MATVAMEYPPSNTILPGSRLLPTASFPKTEGNWYERTQGVLQPDSLVRNWVSDLSRALSGDFNTLRRLFFEEACWRDLLCMSWDFHTLQGPGRIIQFATDSLNVAENVNISLDTSAAHKEPQVAKFGDVEAVQSFIKFDSSSRRGEGLVRLVADSSDGGRWKALTLFTVLKEIKGHEESIHSRRPRGVGGKLEDGTQNWKDRLIKQHNLEGDREPTVLILGRPNEAKVSRV